MTGGPPVHAPPAGRLSGEYLWEIPDPPEGEYKRYEVLDGELFFSGFPLVVHQRVFGNLLVPLATFVRTHRLGEVIQGPFGVILAEYDAVQPDFVFVSNERHGVLSNRAVEGVPDLIIEITEPATSDRDRGIKLQRYAATGLPHYWIIDALEKTIEERTLGIDGYGPPSIYRLGDTFRPAIFPGLAIEIARLWA
jgi:Uma2 family endonuclease